MNIQNEKSKSDAALREEAVLKFWQDNDIFKKSLDKKSPKGGHIFYDGPPFATGLPHYGHILGSTAKDVIGRYQTMQGYHVPRRWGWDCHGLPIENIVEKDLKVSGHKEIEALGVKQFVEHARSKVLTYVHEWKKTVDRIGRWVNFDEGYKTMDNTFIESVWWALKELHEKELLYEGVRVLAYCPRCETPIANSEIAMDNSYKDITDISVYVKFLLAEDSSTSLLAWTTTPWSLPGNIAAAVKENAVYVKVLIDNENYILSKDRLEAVLKDKIYKIVEEFQGSTLVGKKYIPPFDYYTKDKTIAGNPKSWTIVSADFVTTTDGTGIAHEAPAFGEDDMELAKREGLPWINHVTPTGHFKDEVKDFAGLPIKPKSETKDGHMVTDIEIVKYLAKKNILFAKEKIIHSYPHCYRCETPLYYYALPSWFVNIQKVKTHIVKKAEQMEWVPEHLKEGRFKNILEGAPDWTISRNRYWASPLPFWKSKNGGLMVVGSLEELKEKTKKSGNKYFVMRHGEARSNIEDVNDSYGDPENHLTEKGMEQARMAVAKLKQMGITKIFTSPLLRAEETTQIVTEELGLPKEAVVIEKRFIEFDFGKNMQGKAKSRTTDASEHDMQTHINESESLMEVRRRVLEALADIEQKYKNENVLIVTHGSPAWMILTGSRHLNEKETFEFRHARENGREYFIKNTEAEEFEFWLFPHNDNWELDFHRPYIDVITLVDESGNEYTRIPEVIDCWFESGSMPFAQDHYPFERPNWHKENFPADFVAEYIAQTRTWFYYTNVLSTILFNHAPFKHVITTGTLTAEDGEKMSKSKGNFPDPWILFDKYGVDALRLFLMGSPLMKGEDMNFSEKAVDDIHKKIISRLNNVFLFYELYREINQEKEKIHSKNVLDKWIIARLNQLIEETTENMSKYELTEAVRPLGLFVDDLSTWYLRRSRDRIKDESTKPASAKDYGEARQTLYHVLKTLAQVMAPFAPFAAEDMWLKLRNENDKESVHLSGWPIAEKIRKEIIEEMQLVRDLCTVGNALRKKSNIPVRQPLAFFFVTEDLTNEYKEIIKDELNVKAVEKGTVIIFDERITAELKAEGDYREFVRAVQDLRKQAGLTPSDQISITISPNAETLVSSFMDDFKKTVLAHNVGFAENEGEDIRIANLQIRVKIGK